MNDDGQPKKLDLLRVYALPFIYQGSLAFRVFALKPLFG